MLAALNCIRLLSRLLPYIFEDPDWRGFFWSTLPGQAEDASEVREVHFIFIKLYSKMLKNACDSYQKCTFVVLYPQFLDENRLQNVCN